MFKILRCFSLILGSLIIISAPMASDIEKLAIEPYASTAGTTDTAVVKITFEISQDEIAKIAQFLAESKKTYRIEHPSKETKEEFSKQLFQKIHSHMTEFAQSLHTERSMRNFRILSLDGGGIRGFLTCLFLSHLTHITKKPIHELFDMIIATSTGTLIAAGLAIEKPVDKKIEITKPELMLHTDSIPSPYYTPEELATFYLSDGPQIFSGGSWTGGWWGPYYSDTNLNKTLIKFFGDKTLKDLKLPVFLTALDEQRSKIITYSSLSPYAREDKNTFLWHALRGCVAAPTLFPPVTILKKIVGDLGPLLNNPAALGLALAAKHFNTNLENVILFSLGCGHCIDPKGLETYQGMGVKEWATELLNKMFDGQVHDAIIRELHEATKAPHLYLRINPELNTRNMKTDLTTQENFKALFEAAKGEITRREGDFEKIGTALVSNAPQSSPSEVDNVDPLPLSSNGRELSIDLNRREMDTNSSESTENCDASPRTSLDRPKNPISH